VQDLYTASKDNQAFLHAAWALGHDQLQPFKARISRWIFPDLMKGQPISVSKAKKAIRGTDNKGIWGARMGWADSIIIFIARKHWAFWNPAAWTNENTCCFDPHVWTVSGNRILAASCPSAAPTSSVSAALGHAGGMSAGWSRKNSIAFGIDAVDEQQSEMSAPSVGRG